MANDLNVVALVGRLTRESELRYTNGGSAVCRFSIAVNRRKRSGDKWEDEVSYFDCALFGKSAESMNQYLEKGRQVSIIGELRQNRWEQDGQSRSKVEIFVNSLQLLGSGSGDQRGGGRSEDAPRQGGGYGDQSRSGAVSQPRPATPVTNDFGPEQFDDDIPF
ncbi:MAG: single-stranded DNA-binding protein [Sphaerochaetaceae bacterium]|jgi:single-strand DNA-binding protein